MATKERIVGAGICVLLGSSAWAQVTQRVSLAWDGSEGNSYSTLPRISADGRFVAFASFATNLVPGDTNGSYDVFLRDRQTGVVERISVNSDETQGNGNSVGTAISADGRFVAFSSVATNLVAVDTNGEEDIFVRDRQAGTTIRGSLGVGGVEGNAESQKGWISDDGRYLWFSSLSTNLVPGDTNASWDGFMRDLRNGTTERVTVASDGAQGNDHSGLGPVSADGRYATFSSKASNLVPGDTNGSEDIFVRDLQLGITERVSVNSAGTQADCQCTGSGISADGRYVAFASCATNLVPGDTNGTVDVFIRDRQTGTTERVSTDSGGQEGNGMSYGPWISADGSYVAFESFATNLVPGDTNGQQEIFGHDRLSGTTERVCVSSAGAPGNGTSEGDCPVSADGRYVAFWSDSSNLVPWDTNGEYDIFVRDRFGGPSFTTLCDPGVAGVIGCPCGNPPSGPGRGCDNSSSTGGATLSASGETYLSSDSLVFTTSGEKPTALSIATQWTGLDGLGASFGMGVRCAQGPFKRLYSRSAVGGSITVPDLGAGDPSVSARSAALGDPISAGESRWYLVFYRDPIVLGGCAATSTFNATQTGRVDWSF